MKKPSELTGWAHIDVRQKIPHARTLLDLLQARARSTDDEMNWDALAKQAAALSRVAKKIAEELKAR